MDHKNFLIRQGDFEETAAWEALVSANPEKKEMAAFWLRSELKKLDKLQALTGEAPVLSGRMPQRVVIADLAVTLLQYCWKAPGRHLVYLIAELLGVDRHREALAEQASKKMWKLSSMVASWNVLGERCSDRKLAQIVDVSPTTIAKWKRAPDFGDRVRLGETIIRENLVEVRRAHPTVSAREAIRLAWDIERRRHARRYNQGG
jgi:hypothetical protein